MKSTILTAAMLLSLAGPLSTLAEVPAATVEPLAIEVESGTPAVATAPTDSIIEEQRVPETPSQEVATSPTVGSPDAVTSKQPCPMHGMGKMGKMGKGKGKGMGHGDHGQGCKKQGCDRLGEGKQDRHEQVVRRLDMIEARIAKIEVMLESLMQR